MATRRVEPPVVRRIARRAIWFCVVWHLLLWIVLLATWQVAKANDIPLHDLKIIRRILITHFAVLAACLGVFAFRYRRYRRRARAEDYSICVHCAYPLRGLPESHRCPECGHEFDLAESREIWRAWLSDTEFRVT